MEKPLKEAVAHLRVLFRDPQGESEDDRRDRVIDQVVWMESILKQAGLMRHGLNQLFRLIDRKEDRHILSAFRAELRNELKKLQAKTDVHLLMYPSWDMEVKKRIDEILSSDLWCARVRQPLFIHPSDFEKVKKSLASGYIIPKCDLRGHRFRHVDNPLSSMFYHVAMESGGVPNS